MTTFSAALAMLPVSYAALNAANCRVSIAPSIPPDAPLCPYVSHKQRALERGHDAGRRPQHGAVTLK